MTYKEIISSFNELRPNNISDDYKAKIIRELDIKVNNEVFYDKRDIPSLDEAYENTKGICILSPAASSYNEYKNFEEKGRHYKELIKKYGE